MLNEQSIQSQQQSLPPSSQHKRLAIFIGKWINEGYTVPSPSEPAVKILTSDIYEWMPGGYFILHTAYGRIGSMDVGGTEILGYNPVSGGFFSVFYDSRGNVNESQLAVVGDSWTWKGESTGCTAVFTENGKIQTAHHVRLDERGNWVPSMEVVLTKVT